jgi:predicted MPP superfamily phosphohydrolase
MAKLRIPRLKMTRRRFMRLAVGTGGLAAATGFYTWRIEPHWVQFVERPLPIANLPRALEGARLVQLSDLHIGPRVDDAYIISVFNRVAALAPEIVVYTGDFTSYADDVVDHTRRVFRALPRGTRATVGVLGNHDYGRDWGEVNVADDIAELARVAGTRVLRNEVAEVDGLQIVGLDEYWAGRFDPVKAFGGVDYSAATIALSHNPDTADETGWGEFSGWILSGHTHGGQCKAPFLPPPLLPVKNRRYTSGEFDLAGGRRMYINRGVGHLLRVRINARPEVTVFTLARG